MISLKVFVGRALHRQSFFFHRNTSASHVKMTEVELNVEEWKWVLKHIGNSFKGGKQPMTILDKKRFMKIQVITAEEIEWEKEDHEDEDDE